MNETERRDFWWNTVTGPRAVVLDACSALRDGCAVVLKGGMDATWSTDMRNAIERTFKEQMSSEEVLMHVMPGDDCQTEADVGRRLLETFASPKQRSGYRSRSKTTVQEYLVKNGVLRNRLLWVPLESEIARSAWQSFVRAYPGKGVADGLFVLELPEKSACEVSQRMRKIDLKKRISISDLKLLNTFVLSNRYGYGASWREYASSVAASVCYPDAAMGAEFVETADLRSDSVFEVLTALDQRHADEAYPREHALSLLRDGHREDIEHRVWLAQIQTLFPRIEMERIEIIENWRPNVERALEESPQVQFGEPVERPEDLELGLLGYCISHWKPDGDYILYLPVPEVRDRIRFLQRCRNRLAHLNPISTPELVELLDGETW